MLRIHSQKPREPSRFRTWLAPLQEKAINTFEKWVARAIRFKISLITRKLNKSADKRINEPGIRHDFRNGIMQIIKTIAVAPCLSGMEINTHMKLMKNCETVVKELANSLKRTRTTNPTKIIQLHESLSNIFRAYIQDNWNGAREQQKVVYESNLQVGNEKPIQADPGLLLRMTFNLLINALVHADPTQIKLVASATEQELTITVQDNGNGMSAEQAEKFRTGTRFSSRVNSEDHGWGLEIARQAVHNHNGTIELESEPGKGTTFTIRIPLDASSSPS